MKYKTPYYIHFYLDISILVLILVSYESAYQKRKNNFHGVHWFPARNLTKYDPTSNTFNDSITELMLIRMCFPIMYNYSPIKVQNPKKAPIKCFYLFPILAKCLNSGTGNEIPFLRFCLLGRLLAHSESFYKNDWLTLLKFWVKFGQKLLLCDRKKIELFQKTTFTVKLEASTRNQLFPKGHCK